MKQTDEATRTEAHSSPESAQYAEESQDSRVWRILPSLGVPMMAGVMIAYFAITLPGFLTVSNFQSLLTTAALPVIVAVGLTFVLVLGDFDLSIAAVAGVATIIFSELVSARGFSPVLAIVITLVVALFVGLVNGTLVAYVGLAGLVVTIGTASVLDGIQFWVSGSQQISGGFSEFLVDLARSSTAGIPNLVLVAGVYVATAWFLLDKTVLGRNIRACGTNREAARIAGLNVRRIRLTGYMIAAFSAGLAGILFANRQAVAYPLSGLDVLLPSFTAAFIGAATFKMGQFNVPGTVVGVLITTLAANGLILLGAPQYATYIFQGLILLVALLFARVVSMRRT